MKLLWISPRWPFPADDGAKQASAALLTAVAELGHEVGVVTFAREETLAPAPYPNVRLLAHHRALPISPVERAWAVLSSLAGSLPATAVPFARFRLEWRETAQPLGGAPAGVVIDGCHAFAAFGDPACPWPMVYRAHNVETELWEQAAGRAGPATRWFFALQADRMRRLERGLAARCRAIAAISDQDTARFRQLCAGTKAEWVPMGFRFDPPPEIPAGPLTLGYLGRLDWPPNRDGLRWFLREVWPMARLARPGLRLEIAGSGDAAWLADELREGVTFHGRIEDVAAFYARVHAVVVPVHFGSGTKIKLVEAARFGRAIFCTPAARQGSGLSRGAMVAESVDPAAWSGAISSATPEILREQARIAFTEASQAFDAAAAARRFLSLLS